MKQRAGWAVLLLSMLLSITAFATTIEADGIQYRLEEGVAVAIGVDESLDTLTIVPTIEGHPTAGYRVTPTSGLWDTLVFAPGITTLEPYDGLLLSGNFRRIEFPDAYQFENGLSYWLGGPDSFLHEMKLPATVTREAVQSLRSIMSDAYWSAQYDRMYLYGHFEQDAYDEEFTTFTRLSHIEIDPAHPSLYAVDGVVFERGTDTLVAFLPERAESVYEVPEGTRVIGKGAFALCDGLQRIILPSTLTHIEEGAFEQCSAMLSIQLPVGLQSIGRRAFENCVSLSSVIIPEHASVGAEAFRYCQNLRSVYLPGNNERVSDSAFVGCPQRMVVYAQEASTGMRAAAISGVHWSDIDSGSTPQRLPSPLYSHQRPAIVHAIDETQPVPLYAAPSSKADMVAQVDVGSIAELLDEQAGWAHVSLYEGEGYMASENILMLEEDILRIASVDFGSSDSFTLYAWPSIRSPSVELQDDRSRYTVLQHLGPWYYIRIDDETAGYVPENKALAYVYAYHERYVYMAQADKEGRRAALYRAPDLNSEIIKEYYDGIQVNVTSYTRYGEDNAFYSVEASEGTGYMLDETLDILQDAWVYW